MQTNLGKDLGHTQLYFTLDLKVIGEFVNLFVKHRGLIDASAMPKWDSSPDSGLSVYVYMTTCVLKVYISTMD